MATPAVGRPYEITLHYDSGQSGWREIYYFVSADLITPGAVIQVAQTLAEYRRPLMADSCYLTYGRVTALSPFFGTENFYQRDVPLAVPRGGTPGMPKIAWYGRASTGRGEYKRKIWLRGMIAEDTAWQPTVPAAPQLPAKLEAPMKALIKLLTNNDPATNGRGSWCIRAVAKETDQITIVPLTRVAVNTTLGVFTINTGNNEIPLNLPLKIRGARGIHFAGINGATIATKILAIDDFYGRGYQLVKKPQCGPPYKQITPGRVEISVVRFYPITYMIQERISTHKTGGTTIPKKVSKRDRCG